MKHLQKIITAVLIACTLTQSALAQSGGLSGTGNELVCRGDREYSAFLSSVVSYDGFVEYWKDILVRYNSNICLYNDVDNILKQLTKARTQIRKAFYTCDTSAPKLTNTYYKLEAELYFLRKYMNVEKDQITFASDKQVQNEMKDYFVLNKSFFSDEQVAKLYNSFKAKYATHQEAYAQCKDPTWTNLIQKWNEVKGTIGGAANEFKQTVSKRWDRAINTPLLRTGNLLGGLVDFKINGLDPETALSEITADLKKKFPSGYTFPQLNAAKSADQTRAKNQISRTTYLSQYEFQYRETSADITENIIYRLKLLQSFIVGSYKPINQTYQCTASIVNKSCGGT